ncbi:MAG: hypothetical protein A6F72_02815, partial [Cycloclasticus sp. symbiont of Poecilosclerida sp. N]
MPSSDLALTFPGVGSYTINWGDGSATDNASGTISHTYTTAGDYQVVASNDITHFNLNNGADKEKLIDVQQWGSANWTSMENAFAGANNMAMTATDMPDLTGVSSMRAMFQSAHAFNGNISGWNVSNVENMDRMFIFAASFNQNISGWDVSKVTSMVAMFFSAGAFNQNLGLWYIVPSTSTSSTTTTLGTQNDVLIAQGPTYALVAGEGSTHNKLFSLRDSVLTPLDTNQAFGTYDVRVAASGADLFGTNNARSLSINVENLTSSANFVTKWRIPAGSNADRTLTFPSTGNYTINWGDGTTEVITSNSPTHTYTTTGDYKVIASNNITRFNLNNGADKEKLIDVQQWGSANWVNMQGAFYGASNMMMSATDTPDLSGVSSMQAMFREATTFNGVIGGWGVSQVTTMKNMFNGASAFSQDIGGWDVSKVTNMFNMFFGAADFNQNIGGWDVSKVTSMSGMFDGADAFNQNLGHWYIVPTTTMLATQSAVLARHSPIYALVRGAGDADNGLFILSGSTLNPINSDQPTGTYNLRVGASGADLFGTNNARSLSINFENLTSSANFVTKWRIPGGSDTARTLTFPSEGSYTINWGDGTTEDITSNKPTHTYASAGDYKVIASSNITRFNLNNGADKEKLTDVQQWGSASWVSMQGAFYGASNMMMSATDTPDLSGVSSMQVMFRGATTFNGVIGGWGVSQVTTMQNMFNGASAFSQDIGGWDVSKVTNMRGMFDGAADFNQNLGGWDVSKVTNMSGMFDGADAFIQNLGSWYIVPTTTMLTTQNAALTRQSPTYALVRGAGDADNGLFILRGSTLIPKDSEQATGTYNLHVAASGPNLFGTNNASTLSIEIINLVTLTDFVTQWRIPGGSDTVRTL